MPKDRNLDLNAPKLFKPSDIRKLIFGGSNSSKAAGRVDSNVSSTSSFRYDAFGAGMRSTQQTNIDFSKFENHTFFNSALVNVNVGFDKIVNFYPFDGTRKEVEEFEDSLSGFEKHLLDTWPTNKGYLTFSGSSAATGGSYVTVQDMAGVENPAISKLATGRAILDPSLGSISIEFQIYVPDQDNSNQVICQKVDSETKNYGYSIGLRSAVAANKPVISFSIHSGSSLLVASMKIERGRFQHVCMVFDRKRKNSNDKLWLYKDSELITTSSAFGNIGKFGYNFKASNFYIGSGSAVIKSNPGVGPAQVFLPTETFSGSIDEFRVFHSIRSLDDQRAHGKRSIYQNNDLILYMRFNEPSGTISHDDSIVLDYSGNALHSKIINYVHTLRSTGSVSNPMTAENKHLSPVLFPSNPDVLRKNRLLLVTASAYDQANPNLITRLVPPHYFEEGMVFEGLENVEGGITGSYGGTGAPGTGELGTAQMLSAFLYVWAKHFDELKVHIDAFANVLHADYNDTETVPDQFLPFLMDYYGFDMPNMFGDASIAQFVDGEDLLVNASIGENTLQTVQSKIWRQVLTNLQDVIRSKGTIHSVHALIRSVGIDPLTSLRIREYGGPSRRSMSGSRNVRKIVTPLISFSGSHNTLPGTLNSLGISQYKPFIQSPFLSGSRLERGYPKATGTYVNKKSHLPHGISDDLSDGLFTSGSWTYEAIYRFPQKLTGTVYMTQSLARFVVTGTASPSNKHGVVLNLIAVSGSYMTGSRLTLYSRPGTGTTRSDSNVLELTVTGTALFNGDYWWVSFGRQRNDSLSVPASSSYFLRCARPLMGEIVTRDLHTTSSFFKEANNVTTGSVWSNVSSGLNSKGPFFVIGSQSIETSTVLAKKRFLNAHLSDMTDKSKEYHATNFGGQVGRIRFWSKALAIDEWKEHVRNITSLGVRFPEKNFGFTTSTSGSFEKLRLDASAKQSITSSDINKNITIFDYSQNKLHLTGTGFEVSASILKPGDFYYTELSTKIDELTTSNKIRIRSYLDFDRAKENNASIAPLYELNPSEEPADDPRFSVDFSVIDALDEDIIRIFATLEFLDNAIGNPELIFSSDYPKLSHLRHVYFNRLEGAVNHKKLFEFFKWFDTTIGSFIENVIPRKTNFLGTNFVIESHMLERPKMQYYFNEIYLGEIDRRGLKGTITLTQYVGTAKKF